MNVLNISKATKKKAIVVASVTAIVGLASLGGIVSATSMAVSADKPKDTGTNHQGLVDAVAEHFNLNKSDVQKVFDEQKQARQAAHDKKLDEQLSRAVTAGKITDVQKTAITTKYQELRDYRQSIQDKPRDEQRQLMKTKLNELRTWAEDNGLGQYLHLLDGHRGLFKA